MHRSKLIPEARRDAVYAGLRAAFGTSMVGEFQPIIGGVSGALILRFDVRGRPHVLRLEPERITRDDCARGYACMAAAAVVGVAPRLQYADPETGVAIMNFVSSRPLAEHPDGPVGVVRALGALIARIQTTPRFPSLGAYDYPAAIASMLAGLSKSGLGGSVQFSALADGLARIQAALSWDASSLVSTHNDPNPRNILFDGERVWLIDWELACRNDPLVDVAILTTDLAETRELEDALLEAAFGKPPDQLVRARLTVIRLLTRLFYGCVVLDSLSEAVRAAPDEGMAALTPAAFRAAVTGGRLAKGAPETAHAFARMSLAAFLDGIADPKFEMSLDLARQG
jgi:hypothetical protein